MEHFELRQEMITIGKKLYERELIVATEGNYSVRLDESRLLATPRGVCKGELTPEDLVIIDIRGNHLEGGPRVSSEIAMHLEVYQQRPDAQAVLHAHPPHCVALMLAGEGLDRPILAENVIVLGKVPIAPYARPSTPEVPAAVRPYVHRTDCILLDHHGSLTIGQSLREAYYKLEMMENAAKAYLLAMQMGRVREIDPLEIKELMALRENTYRMRWPIIPFEQY